MAVSWLDEFTLNSEMPDESAMPRQTSLEWIRSSDGSPYSSVIVHSGPLGGRV